VTLRPNERTEAVLANILLVDDRDDDLELTRIALFKRPRLRCNLQIARDGREAYGLLTGTQATIDLMLLDINMPDVNGFELLERVRGDASLRRTTIVMCSGSDYEPDQRRAFGLGAAGYLIKPPRFTQLKNIIDRLPSLRLDQNGFETCLTRASA
jgi:CheY-like chemotaxis protein